MMFSTTTTTNSSATTMMMRRRGNAPGLLLSLSNQADLDHALVQATSSTTTSIAVVLPDPCFVREQASQIQTFFSQLPASTDVRLAVRGVGKLLVGGRVAAAEEARANTVEADSIASFVAACNNAGAKLTSLEISVTKLDGSLQGLQTAIMACSHLQRVVFHQCDIDHHNGDARHQGLLPLLETLSRMPSLQSLVLEAVEFPVGDITANVLSKLAHVERLEFKHCVNLGDEELLPLVQGLKCQHFKLSTGFFQQHAGRTWGNVIVQALAQALASPQSTLTNLSVITTTASTPSISLRPIVQSLQTNTSLQRLHLYQNTGTDTGSDYHTATTPANSTKKATKKTPLVSLANELVALLAANQNMTLLSCNSLGCTNRHVASAMNFYLRLNQLNRKDLLTQYAAPQGDARWIQLLVEQSHDPRIVQYLLSNHPSLIVVGNMS